jgi:hypothetical protein
MSVLRLFKPFAEEVSYMSEYDEYKVRNVCGYEIKVRRFIHDGLRDGLTFWMTTDMSMGLVTDFTKLRISFCFFLK